MIFVGVIMVCICSEMGLQVCNEVFVDCVYDEEGYFVYCKVLGVVLYDLDQVVECMLWMVQVGVIEMVFGCMLFVQIDMICVYSDILGVIDMVVKVWCMFEYVGIVVKLFS